ncbi:acetyltransferase (GNAT) domain-containing protein [Nocardia nova SH22a]|uniref:Acetyltransferase (GNAT) domain-containing protein n=1 Tax=Nocardia nova SH22a TaxID=1415166 RepID=W5TIE1_9NOCA|nr:GNAT family N-acetyltransferase [Nocardia nova]AHH16991.1 acetyltransferase (GNAT) domain-containing protein [Nocardia nova SH22a]
MTEPQAGRPRIRDAEERDIPAILAIHNNAVAETTAIWDSAPVDLDDRLRWWRDRVASGYPVLVAEIDGELAGYASYAQWRPKSGYRHCVENSVYVAERFQRRGAATALLTTLMARAEESGRVHTVIAAIETSNKTSILLHEKFGFRIVGQLPEVGHKFGGWMDLTLMQRTLPGPISPGVESSQ